MKKRVLLFFGVLLAGLILSSGIGLVSASSPCSTKYFTQSGGSCNFGSLEPSDCDSDCVSLCGSAQSMGGYCDTTNKCFCQCIEENTGGCESCGSLFFESPIPGWTDFDNGPCQDASVSDCEKIYYYSEKPFHEGELRPTNCRAIYINGNFYSCERNAPCTITCVDKCDVEGSQKCNVNYLLSCVKQENGCLDWEVKKDCNELKDKCVGEIEGTFSGNQGKFFDGTCVGEQPLAKCNIITFASSAIKETCDDSEGKDEDCDGFVNCADVDDCPKGKKCGFGKICDCNKDCVKSDCALCEDAFCAIGTGTYCALKAPQKLTLEAVGAADKVKFAFTNAMDNLEDQLIDMLEKLENEEGSGNVDLYDEDGEYKCKKQIGFIQTTLIDLGQNKFGGDKGQLILSFDPGLKQYQVWLSWKMDF